MDVLVVHSSASWSKTLAALVDGRVLHHLVIQVLLLHQLGLPCDVHSAALIPLHLSIRAQLIVPNFMRIKTDRISYLRLHRWRTHSAVHSHETLIVFEIHECFILT